MSFLEKLGITNVEYKMHIEKGTIMRIMKRIIAMCMVSILMMCVPAYALRDESKDKVKFEQKIRQQVKEGKMTQQKADELLGAMNGSIDNHDGAGLARYKDMLEEQLKQRVQSGQISPEKAEMFMNQVEERLKSWNQEGKGR